MALVKKFFLVPFFQSPPSFLLEALRRLKQPLGLTLGSGKSFKFGPLSLTVVPVFSVFVFKS